MITTVGFPIVACLGMAWYVKYITDKNNERLDKQNEQHAEDMKSVTSALNNNTVALTKLAEKLDKEVQK
jgi:hypothetical protein